ncbi:MAG: flavocytochrome c [Clostridia bacterium]|nr:flavocytochrome c [Clostridia bacterium]
MKKILGIILAVSMLFGMTATAEGVTAQGTAISPIGGEVVVEVTADANTIYDVKVISHNETPSIGGPAAESVPADMVEYNTLAVDDVTNATLTSVAIREAAKNALIEAGIDPTPFEVKKEQAGDTERTAEELSCDVLIIGAGGAGLTAAVKAAQEGANVIVLEQMAFVGGNTLKATGGMNAASTHLQAAAGITDSTVETFIEDTMNGGHQKNDLALVTTMAENSAEAIAWLEEIGAPLPKIAPTGGTTHKYLHEPEDGSAVGNFLVEKMMAVCDQLNIKPMTNTEATELLVEDGKVVGAVAHDKKHDYTIRAGAVIVATGGFGANFDLMCSYDPSLNGAVTTNHSGADGDGIILATAIGADTVDMDQIQLHPTVHQETSMLITESLRSAGAILINADGVRFTNDMSTRDAVSQAELKQPGSFAWIIFDQRIVDHQKSTAKYINGGLTVTADTYEGLAEQMGVDPAAFAASMEKWNAAVAAGVDEEFGRNNGIDEDLSQAPYYAIKVSPGIHHTMGGLKIDTDTHVINTEGSIIDGLFAAGEVTGGVHGGNRIGGNAVCDIVVFGRIAGTNAAAYALGK